jgi:hypothetical protein
MSVCCECCVLSGRGLCDELITRPDESYRLWCVVVCDLETSWMKRPWPTWGLLRQIKLKKCSLHKCNKLTHSDEAVFTRLSIDLIWYIWRAC